MCYYIHKLPGIFAARSSPQKKYGFPSTKRMISTHKKQVFHPQKWDVSLKNHLVGGFNPSEKYYSYGPLPVISTYNPIYRMYNPTYNQL